MAAGLLLVVAPLVWAIDREPSSFGTLPETEFSTRNETPGTAAAGVPPARGDTDPAVTRPATVVPTRSARLADQPVPTAAVEPVRLRVPEVGLDVPVDPVGVVAGSTEMAVPEDVRRAGWYRHGPAPGSDAGTAVLAGHVDSRRQGLGAFAQLADLRPGDLVEVELADERTVVYEVSDRGQIAKQDLETGELFSREGPPRLALVTCGGRFDPGTRTYEDNVVVLAEARG